jgi:formate hydrogenlyase transcriptional activator
VLLSPGRELRVPVAELKALSPSNLASSTGDSVPPNPLLQSVSVQPSNIVRLEEAERQHILRALRQTEWRIAGPRGAASLLGVKRTTLQARMRKLNIKRPI